MTMLRPSPPAPSRGRAVAGRAILRLLAAAALGVAAALLVSCGSSATKLIPAANVGPLQSDFEAVAQAARKRGVDTVVCGHIHRAEMRDIDGVLYCNDGDWVESCTSLVEDMNGHLRLIDWSKSRQQAAVVPTVLPVGQAA